jgi:hypothetical protein
LLPRGVWANANLVPTMPGGANFVPSANANANANAIRALFWHLGTANKKKGVGIGIWHGCLLARCQHAKFGREPYDREKSKVFTQVIFSSSKVCRYELHQNLCGAKRASASRVLMNLAIMG